MQDCLQASDEGFCLDSPRSIKPEEDLIDDHNLSNQNLGRNLELENHEIYREDENISRDNGSGHQDLNDLHQSAQLKDVFEFAHTVGPFKRQFNVSVWEAI